MDNVNLTEPILSRFDLLFVVKDEINREKDFNLAGFVLNSHIKSHPLVSDSDESKKNDYVKKIPDLLLDSHEV